MRMCVGGSRAQSRGSKGREPRSGTGPAIPRCLQRSFDSFRISWSCFETVDDLNHRLVFYAIHFISEKTYRSQHIVSGLNLTASHDLVIAWFHILADQGSIGEQTVGAI